MKAECIKSSKESSSKFYPIVLEICFNSSKPMKPSYFVS